MPLEFAGSATPLTDADIEAAAKKIGCQVAAVRAVIAVESGGGFLADGRPKILFERHYFSRLTKGKFNASHPDISHPKWGGYGKSSSQYDRLARAIRLDRDAALRSASWGAFQIMGDNCKMCGFNAAEEFVTAMVSGSAAQLDAFINFIRKSGLDDEMVRCNWAAFARGYNGPAYRENNYDTRLAAAFQLHFHGGANVDSPRPTLRQGDKGEAVADLQRALKLVADGDFGPGTKKAVVAFQKAHGLFADGIAGRATWALLDD